MGRGRWVAYMTGRARGGRAAATATNSHGEMVLGGVHGRESLRLNLHCLGPLTVERKWAPPAGYCHPNLLIRVDRTASFVHRLVPPLGQFDLSYARRRAWGDRLSGLAMYVPP